MYKLRILLYPIALIYGLATAIRNILYDKGILKSYRIPFKSIVVGNLSLGGTGKSPLVEYLVRLALKSDIKTATLSRGYGRNTKGLRLADNTSNAESIGDEPMSYFEKFGTEIQVIVAEDRTSGVKYIEENFSDTELVILDDAFQHRRIRAGLNIVVTDFYHPFYKDLLLPAGNLREPRSGIHRADIVIVSKCPDTIDESEMNNISNRIGINRQKIFFSVIRYLDLVSINRQEKKNGENVLLVTGIGNPEPLVSELSKRYKVDHIAFRDHHDFSPSDVSAIHKKFNSFASRYSCIITTEKDFMRLKGMDEIHTSPIPWFFQKIELEVINGEEFRSRILNYVGTN